MKKLVLLIIAGIAIASCNNSNNDSAAPGGTDTTNTSAEPKKEVIKLQGDSVMDESFAINSSNGDIYVGSSSDGSIQKVSGGVSTWFYPAEKTDHKIILGTAVDDKRSRLWAVNIDFNNPMSGNTSVRVFDLNTKAMLKTLFLRKDGKPHGLNDLVIDKDGNAFITDSYSPIIYKAGSDLQGIDVFATDPSFTIEPKFLNLQGIDITPDGKYLVATAANSGFDTTHPEGGIWRIGLADKKVQKIDVPGYEGGDGFGFAADHIAYSIGRFKGLAKLTFTNDYTEGKVEHFTSPEITALHQNAPNSLRVYGGRVYVAPSQMDRIFPPGNPNYQKPFDPFVIIAIPAKDIK